MHSSAVKIQLFCNINRGGILSNFGNRNLHGNFDPQDGFFPRGFVFFAKKIFDGLTMPTELDIVSLVARATM